MRLEVFCKSCKEKIKIKSKALSRPYLMDDIGEYFRTNCDSCSENKEYHVNEVKASSSGSLFGFLAGLLVMILVTVFFWNQGWITNLGLILGLAIIIGTNGSMLSSNSTAFNKYFVKATIKD